MSSNIDHGKIKHSVNVVGILVDFPSLYSAKVILVEASIFNASKASEYFRLLAIRLYQERLPADRQHVQQQQMDHLTHYWRSLTEHAPIVDAEHTDWAHVGSILNLRIVGMFYIKAYSAL